MTLDLSKEEGQVLLQFIDIGVKQAGLAAVNGAYVLQHKINAAIREDEKPAEPVAPAQ